MENYFNPVETAIRYASGRPYFHELSIRKVKDRLGLKKDDLFPNGLDIACGTGLSTKALRLLAKDVVGTDASAEMLAQAKKIKEILFLESMAENQPFLDASFDVITVSSGIHWFDINTFMKECHRLLRADAFLVVYDNFFLSKMIGEAAFDSWFPDQYLKRYPSPPRNSSYAWEVEELDSLGFQLIDKIEYVNEVEFSKEALILYFTTQSNISNHVSKSNQGYDGVEAWLSQALQPFFKTNPIQRLQFGNWIRILQKSS